MQKPTGNAIHSY